MRYNQIRAFHYAAVHKGFSRAADALSLTQPAVSEQILRLESDHDVLLFNRERKQIALTPAGEQLFQTTKQFFEIEQQLVEILSENRAALKGTLRIMADSTFHLTNSLKHFRERHPKVLISIKSGNTTDILNALRNYDVEIGLVGSVKPGQDMDVVSLGTSPIIAFCAKDYFKNPHPPMTFKELAKHPLIFREKGSKTRQKLEEEMLRQGITLRPAFEVEGREAIQEIVAAGGGIGFVSEAELRRDPRLVKLPLECSTLTMGESLVHLKQRRNVRSIRAFMAFSQEQIG